VQRDSYARFSPSRVGNELLWLLFDREAPVRQAARTSGVGWLGPALLVGGIAWLAEHQLVTSVWPALMSARVSPP
jgi:hypothetical protein